MKLRFLLFLLLLVHSLQAFPEPSQPDSLLTREELAWLKTHGQHIRYAPNPSWPPGDFVDENGRHQGIISDYIKIFEEELGVQFTKVQYNNWNEMYSALLDGRIDFLGAIQKTKEREQLLLFTDPVMNIPIVILVNSGSGTDFSDKDLDGMKICAVKGYITQDFLQEHYTNYELLETDDDLTSLVLTSMGSADGAIVDLMTASYLVETYGITNLSIGTQLDFTWHLGFAFHKDQEMLYHILNKVLLSIPEEDRREIFNKWVNIEFISKQNFFQRNYKILVGSMLFFILAGLIFLSYSIILRSLVRKRTLQLNDELLAKNKAIEQARKNEARLESLFELSNIKTDKSSVFLDYALMEIIRLTESKFGLLYKYSAENGKFELASETLVETYEAQLSRVNPIFSASELEDCRHNVIESPELQVNICTSCKLFKRGACPLTDSRIPNTLVFPIVDEERVEALLYLANNNPYDRADSQQVILLINAVWRLLSKQKWQEELVIAKAKAEESDRLKSAFLANLSHEIRTPMNGIIGFSDLLREADLTEKQRHDYLGIIHKSTHYLLSVITDIIEISRIESGSIEPNLSVFNIDQMIEEVRMEALHSMNGQKDLSLLVERGALADTAISSDEIKLKQIILNLVSNAIKYTEQGYIKISYSIIGEQLEIKIEDTGPGIDEKYHSVIFERFRQGDKELAIQKGGTGLGLSITESYVNMLGGSISLQSELGRGSEFSIVIPVKTVAVKREAVSQEHNRVPGPNSNKTVLIAEDNQANFIYLEELLREFDYQILHAWNGKEAIQFLEEHPGTDLVLLDLKMPGMDGYQVMEWIRSKALEVPVIAQTAYALSDDLIRIRNSGFDGYLSKPIVRRELMDVLTRYLGKQNSD